MSLLTLSDKESGRDARMIDMEQEKGKEVKGKEVKEVVGQKKGRKKGRKEERKEEGR